MSRIHLRGASFAYDDAVAILHDVDLALAPGWTGLVGANGAGKSTLLRLLDGSLRPSVGTVAREPPVLRITTCPQQVDACTPEIRRFAADHGGLARRMLGRLRLDADALARWPTLSPGERKRWQIGAALADEPDALLLDEPTNHLDAQARRWLCDALWGFSGIGVIVSHDRELLDALTSRTLRIAAGRVESVELPYSTAKQHWDRALKQRLDARQAAQDDARRLTRRLDSARRDRGAAERQRSAGVRMKDRHDSDARGILATTKASWAEARLGRTTGILRREVARAEAAIERIELDVPLGRSVFARYQRCPLPHLAACAAGPIARGGRTIVTTPALVWGRDDRIRICGANGAGKTTVVEALLAGLRVPADRVLVLAQDPAVAEIEAAMAWLRGLASEVRGHVLAVVAALGVAPERLLATTSPSPGEARKLLLARGLVDQVWGLVLDEPTNHLDLPSIERLEAALVDYPGAILLVTHDDALAHACTRERWTVARGQVAVA